MAVEIANISAEICCSCFLLTLLGALLLKEIKSRTVLCIALIFTGETVAVITDLIFRIVGTSRPIDIVLYIDYVISFTASVFLMCSFYWYFLARFEEKGKAPFSIKMRRWISVYAGLIIVLFASSVWTGWFFYVTDSGKLGYTEYFYWVMCLMLPICAADFIMIGRHKNLLGVRETVVSLTYIILPIIAYCMDIKYSTVIAHLVLTIDAGMLYVFIDSQQERKLARKEYELAQAQLNMMVGQINPHFIYNTLGSIESLAATDPAGAQKLMSEFSDYLCDNYVDMTKQPLISFSEEMKHVEHYLSIEKVRFPNLTVEYDIRATDFDIPCLTVQPLVENAVKHGICRQRKSAGDKSAAARCVLHGLPRICL